MNVIGIFGSLGDENIKRYQSILLDNLKMKTSKNINLSFRSLEDDTIKRYQFIF